VRFEVTTDLVRASECNCSICRKPRADPRKFMVNVRCVDGVDLDRLRIEKFDGRSWELRPDAPYTGIWKD